VRRVRAGTPRVSQQTFLSRIKPLAAALALLCGAASPAPTLPSWADFKAPQRVTIKGYNGHIMEAALSRDGAILFFNNRNNPPHKTNLHWATRIDDVTFIYMDLAPGANSAALDGVPTISKDNRFCFVSLRDYARTLSTVYCGRWNTGKLTDVSLQGEASLKTPGRVVFDIDLNHAGDELILTDGSFANGSPLPAAADFKMARLDEGGYRLSPSDTRLFAALNSDALEYAPATSANGLELAFTRARMSGKSLVTSIWIAQRKKTTDAYGSPVRITTMTGEFVEAPSFSPDGKALYFHRVIKGKYTLWRSER
jgi:hypothetical protein